MTTAVLILLYIQARKFSDAVPSDYLYGYSFIMMDISEESIYNVPGDC